MSRAQYAPHSDASYLGRRRVFCVGSQDPSPSADSEASASEASTPPLHGGCGRRFRIWDGFYFAPPRESLEARPQSCARSPWKEFEVSWIGLRSCAHLFSGSKPSGTRYKNFHKRNLMLEYLGRSQRSSHRLAQSSYLVGGSTEPNFVSSRRTVRTFDAAFLGRPWIKRHLTNQIP